MTISPFCLEKKLRPGVGAVSERINQSTAFILRVLARAGCGGRAYGREPAPGAGQILHCIQNDKAGRATTRRRESASRHRENPALHKKKPAPAGDPLEITSIEFGAEFTDRNGYQSSF